MRDLGANGVRVAGKRILLVGAGGAARSVLGNLLDEQPAGVTVINRTRARAVALLELFPEAGGILSAQGFDEAAAGPYDLVINGASAGLAGQALPLPDGVLAPGACCYDMVYGKAARGVPGLGPRATARQHAWTAWGCWWSKPPNHSISGAASARKRNRSSTPSGNLQPLHPVHQVGAAR